MTGGNRSRTAGKICVFPPTHLSGGFTIINT
jgi:hypothetical protein